MKSLKELILENDWVNTKYEDKYGNPLTRKRFTISFDQLVMLYIYFKKIDLSADEFKKIFGNSRSYDEFEMLMKNFKEGIEKETDKKYLKNIDDWINNK